MNNEFECSSCGKRGLEINRVIRLKIRSEQKTFLFCSPDCCGIPVLIFISSLNQMERLALKEIIVFIFDPEETSFDKPIVQPYPNGEILYQSLLRAEEIFEKEDEETFLSIKTDVVQPEFVEMAKGLKVNLSETGQTEEDKERLKAYFFKLTKVLGVSEPRPYKL